MKRTFFAIIFILPLLTVAQDGTSWRQNSMIYTPELLVGWSNKANENFPEARFQKQVGLSIRRNQKNNPQEWAQRMRNIKTGLSFMLTDFDNRDDLGFAITVMPIIEFPIFGSERLKLQSGLGVSYHNRKFHEEKNPYNQAISKSLAWAYRLYLYYDIAQFTQIDWRIGGGYSHHSNGHTKLRNQGLNSFLIGVSADIKPYDNKRNSHENSAFEDFSNSVYSYLSFRTGLGKNVLSTAFNDKRNVYVFSGEYGKVFNNTWKIGMGFYYNFYQHYYDYINDNHSLVQPGREFYRFQKNPFIYASNVGLTIHGEVLLNHFGIDLNFGYNLYKPAYKIDWRINEGWRNTPVEIPENWVLGEYNDYFKLKYRISARLGLKYYFLGTHVFQKHNLFVGAHINSNLGQADFSELSFGYVYNFKR
ncbi:MAG TPA: acyloxyacyl hydrolase [Flavobacteriaceae bacterium]|nr:acyloxyacyl hydrolase [Flavobacteriaceae bacterium]